MPIVVVTARLRICGLPADSNKRRRATQQRNAVVPGKCMTAAARTEMCSSINAKTNYCKGISNMLHLSKTKQTTYIEYIPELRRCHVYVKIFRWAPHPVCTFPRTSCFCVALGRFRRLGGPPRGTRGFHRALGRPRREFKVSPHRST